MNKFLKLLLVIPVTILAYLVGYLGAYYAQSFSIGFMLGGDITKGFNAFSLPLLCSGFGMWSAVVAGTLTSPLSKLIMLRIFLFVLIVLVLLSIIPLFTKAFNVKPISEIIGLTAGYLIARTTIFQEADNEETIVEI
ncbi:hypothetical protein A5893_17325 [Pedobacter psychrophilus]|uniref:Uncharacterized protein n=1 Tax=Pedobacter psychrophilus TaxID=1826909 RepID=A0A179DP48_9SPHI|nr:hypothetical protein [Pedobacter psychrophilus]OAQ42817.1 hypothetical protein A5893_17325 [Pedobacter psychrophilus]